MLIRGEPTKVIRSTRYKILGFKCDKCKTDFRLSDDTRKIKYFDVTTGHNDWGNDSCDSIEHHDICPDCIAKFTSSYLTNCRDTAFIDIEATTIYDGKLGDLLYE